MKRLYAALTTLAMIVLIAAAAPVPNEAQNEIAQRGVMPPADYSLYHMGGWWNSPLRIP